MRRSRLDFGVLCGVLLAVSCSEDPADPDAKKGSGDAGQDAAPDSSVDSGPDGLAGSSGSTGADGAAGSSGGLCPWEKPKGTATPFVVHGTTALEDGDVALLLSTSLVTGDVSCSRWFVEARTPITNGSFELSIPAPPPPGAAEVAEAWETEYLKSPRVVSGQIVALKPGTSDHPSDTELEANLAFVALDLAVYSYEQLPAGEALFVSWLYGALAPGHHLVALTEKLTNEELTECLLATTPGPNCICWYSTPGSTQGYGYCSIAERAVIAPTTPLAVDVPYSGSNLYSL